MGLKRTYLTRLARVLTLLLLVLALPIESASAAATFDAPIAVNPSGLSNPTYSAIASTLDGTTLIAASYGYLLKSTDTGTTWDPITTAGVKNWSAVATNDTGTVIVAAESGGGIWLSTNSGSTFTLLTSGVSTAASWYWLDTNATGAIIAASDQSTSVYISTNTGTSWTTRAVSGSSTIKTIYVSGAGDRMALLSATNTTLFTSSNTGATWTAQNGGGLIANSAPTFLFSRDGQRILYMRSGAAYLSKTTDFGATWETLTAPTSYGIAMTASDDLSKIWIGPNGGNSYYSTNSGTSWTSSVNTGAWKLFYINPSGMRWISFLSSNGIWTSEGVPSAVTFRNVSAGVSNWSRSSISNDGSVIAVASAGGEINTSQDGGATWRSISSAGRSTSWNCMAVSGDGNVIYAGGYSTRIYKSVDRGVTFTALSGTNIPSVATSIYGCSTNSDGTKFSVSIGGGGLYYSSAGASSLTLIKNRNACTGTVELFTVAMSNDGTKFATVCNTTNSYLLVSSNSGSTWETTTLTSTNFFRDIKASADGSVLMAVFGNTTAPQISRNWGSSWTPVTGVGTYYGTALSISSDGSYIILGQYTTSGILYYSSNRGASFSQITGTSTGSYTSGAISGDGSKIVFAADGRFINTLSVTITISYATITSIALNSSPTYRRDVVLTATLSTSGTDGRVTFFASGKAIAGCTKVISTTLIATCTWKPANRGAVVLSATSYPTDTSYLSSSKSLQVNVTNRTGLR